MTRRNRNAESETRPVSDTGFSPQQILEMGQAASQLLGNPVYNLAHRIAVDDIINKWSTSGVQEVKLRESLWHELQAHGKAAQHLGSLVARAQEILQQQASEQGSQEAEYLDNQGFGAAPFGSSDNGEMKFQ